MNLYSTWKQTKLCETAKNHVQTKKKLDREKKKQRLKSPAHQMLHIDWISRVYTYEYVHTSCVEIVNEMSISFYVPFLFCSYKAAHKNPNHSSIHRAFHVCVCVFEWRKNFFALCSSFFFFENKSSVNS